MKTLGDLLPKKQAALLTDKVKQLTKAEIEKQARMGKHSDLSYFDIKSLRYLMVTRINDGLTILTYDKQSFKKEGNDGQDPSTCSCFNGH